MARQENKKVVLAILSPSKNAYSETFIQEHRNIPFTSVKFYYNGSVPGMLEGYGDLIVPGTVSRLMRVAKRKISGTSLSADQLALAESFKREKIECVLAEYGTTGAVIFPVCKSLNLPLIVHFHGYDASIKHILVKNEFLYKQMFEYAGAVVVVSKIMEAKIIELGCPIDKVHLIPCAPKNIFYDIVPQFTEQLFIGIGRFVNKKAPYYTLLAFKKVLEKFPDAKLIIGGDGILWETCVNLVKALGLQKNVELPGIMTAEQFTDYLTKARAFVQHSIEAENGDMEGTPVAILEASMAGIPVISTFHAGIPDVIIDKQTGLLVSEHDVAGMAENMCKVLEDICLAKSLGAAGKVNIFENFSLQKELQSLSELILKQVK